jgi:hypothetical protein
MARKKASSARGSKASRRRKSQPASDPAAGIELHERRSPFARRFSGARTETEAVNTALDFAAFQSEVEAGIER